MNDQEFLVQWITDSRTIDGLRVLDYGCGKGNLVQLLRSRNISGFGCDVFYEGGDYSDTIGQSIFESGVIKRMYGDNIPFEDDSFDIVVNTQVMEHVPDLDIVLSEIYRVLKPGRAVLSLFPDKGVWREGHCGIPFLHWFPKRSKLRVYYAALLRSIGLGHFKKDKSVFQWSRDFCDWLDKWTYYRNRSAIEQSYKTRFGSTKHIEDYWLRSRLGALSMFLIIVPKWGQKLVARKWAGLVFVACKAVI